MSVQFESGFDSYFGDLPVPTVENFEAEEGVLFFCKPSVEKPCYDSRHHTNLQAKIAPTAWLKI